MEKNKTGFFLILESQPNSSNEIGWKVEYNLSKTNIIGF